MGLAGFEDLPTKMLSQGQKRRVALARLLLSKAPLWILDEPFVALDTSAVQFLQSIITNKLQNGGLVLLTTHQEIALTAGEIRQLQLVLSVRPMGIYTQLPSLGGFRFQVGVTDEEVLIEAKTFRECRHLGAGPHRTTKPDLCG